VGDVRLVDEGQDHRTLGEARGGSRQAVKVAATFDVFLVPQIADDALPGPAILTDGLDQVDVGVAADPLFTRTNMALAIWSGADSSSQKQRSTFEFSTTPLCTDHRNSKSGV
jgi:hypothetical protein